MLSTFAACFGHSKTRCSTKDVISRRDMWCPSHVAWCVRDTGASRASILVEISSKKAYSYPKIN